MTAEAVRVAVLAHPAGARGGVAVFTERLVEHLRPEAEVQVLRYGRLYPRWSVPGRAEREAVARVPRGATTYLPWTWIGPIVAMLRQRPSMLVVQWWQPLAAPFLLALMLAARVGGVRIGVVCHNALPHEHFPSARLLTRLVLRRADVLFTLSDHVRREVGRLAPAARVEVVGHPANVAAAVEQASAPRSDRAAARLLFFGHVRPYKGLDDLLEAMARTTTTPAPTLTVAGPFYTSAEAVRQRAETLGVADRVRLVDGYVPDADVPAMFAAADLVVLPYRNGSQSGVLSLAAEFGRPVVVTDVGSLAADVAGQGVVVPAADPVALAAGIDAALASPPPAPPTGGTWPAWAAAVVCAATRSDAARTAPVMTRSRRLRAGAVWGVVLACTVAVLARTIANAHDTVWPTTGALALAAAALAASRALHVAEWHLLLRGYGVRIRPLTSARILTSAELARFVPGGVWHLAAAYRMSVRAGVPAPAIIATSCTDLAVRLATAFAVFFAGIWAWPRLSGVGLVGGVLGLAVALVAMQPTVVRGLARRLTRRRNDADTPLDLSPVHFAAALSLSVLFAVARGLAAVALLAGLGRHVDARVALLVTGAVALAWALGVLVPFAPGGLGVQEATGTLLLSALTPAATAATVFVLLRVVQIAVELLTTAGCIAVERALGRTRVTEHPVAAYPDSAVVTAGQGVHR